MKTPRISPQLLLGIALSAVFSLAIAHGFDLARFDLRLRPGLAVGDRRQHRGPDLLRRLGAYGLRHMHRQYRHGAC